MDLDTWACPVCLGTLSETEEGLRCSAEDLFFRDFHDVPVLLRPEDERLFKDALDFGAAWKRSEWAPPPGAFLELPYLRKRGWSEKARSLDALLDILGPSGGRKVADLGAGTGWLSHRLTRAGFRCYATDLSPDPEVGLGAARALDATSHTFERAIASLMHWPVHSGSMDVAVCNASLHYLSDIRPAIAEAERVLRRDGTFVVMNEPVHHEKRSAELASVDFRDRMRRLGGHGTLLDGYRHFVVEELEADLRRSFRNLRRHDPDFGFWFRSTRAAKGVILGLELASFPIYVARRG